MTTTIHANINFRAERIEYLMLRNKTTTILPGKKLREFIGLGANLASHNISLSPESASRVLTYFGM